MAALIAAARDPGYPAAIELVVSNRSDAAGLLAARAAGIRAEAVDHRIFGGDRAGHESAIDAVLRSEKIEVVCLAGYLRLLTPFLVNAWLGRMLNIHPSLLPSFPGLRTHARALEAGVRLHGCTVHLVTQEMDAGPILAQAARPSPGGRHRGRSGPASLAAGTRDLPGGARRVRIRSSRTVPRPGRFPWPIPWRGRSDSRVYSSLSICCHGGPGGCVDRPMD